MSASTTKPRPGMAHWISVIMIVAVVLGGLGFVYKLMQFSREALGEEATSFAAVPIVVYLCVAGGFFCLFLWAMSRGQFRDVERPKYRMLEREESYDRGES